MAVHVDRIDDAVRQCVSIDGEAVSVIGITYFSATESIETGRRMVELGEELLRERKPNGVRGLEHDAVRLLGG